MQKRQSHDNDRSRRRLSHQVAQRHPGEAQAGSTLKRELTKLLVAQKFIASFTEVKESAQGVLRIQLKYNDGQPVIAGLRRVSRPGLRHYVDADGIPRVLGGLGVAVISTPKGLMTDKQARLARMGGEVLCEVW